MAYTYYLDDGGDSSFQGKGKFWVLGGLVVPNDRWRDLRNKADEVLSRHRIPVGQELKWADAGIRIKQLVATDEAQKPKKRTPLHHVMSKQAVQQVYFDLLDIISAIPEIRVMFAWCVKKDARLVCTGKDLPADERCYREMFHDAIERYEYFLTTGDNEDGAFGHVVMDHKSKKFDDAVRYTADGLLRKGTQFVKINHVIDGVHIGDSRTMFGLRMADYVVGALHSHLEHGYSGYFKRFQASVHTDAWGNINGSGAKRFPTAQKHADSPVSFPQTEDQFAF